MAYHNRHASSIAALLIIGGFTAALMAQAPRPTFEVASVRKQPAFIPPSKTPPSSVVFHRLNTTVASLVQFGYGIRDFQVIGGPEWVRKDLFEINAKAASEASTEQMRLMVQSLLDDRFKLAIRKEQREMRGSALVLARDDRRLGPKLEKCGDPGNPPPAKKIRVPPGGMAFGWRCTSLAPVVDLATGIMRSPVVDRTGLTGMWNYELAYAQSEPLPPGPVRDLADAENVPSFSTALQEQLGLKLEPTRGPVDVVLIDSVQQPTEN